MIRFIHAADIHLDSPLRGLDKYEGAPADSIRNATRIAFTNLVELAICEPVDFVILAGDIYDGDWRDYNTGLFFVNGLRRLNDAGVPVFLLSGNHDAESQITSRLTFPANTRAFTTNRSETFMIDDLRVAIHGQGFAERAVTRNLAADYPPARPSYFNIGVLHTALDGREGHEPYAPCTLPQLLAKEYDYWALGHVHGRESVNVSGRVRVEFPGNVQGRHIRETGAKGCLLVTVDSHGNAQPHFRALDVFRWTDLAVDASSAESEDEASGLALQAISAAIDEADGRPFAVRIRLSCPDAVYRQISIDPAQFRFDLAGQTSSDVWIEQVKLQLPLQTPEATPALTGDAGSELKAALAELRSDPESVHAIFAAGDCGKLMKLLPQAIRESLMKQHADVIDRAAALLAGATAEEES